VVALVVAYRKGIIQINLENASTHTRIAMLPALLCGKFPIYSYFVKIFCVGLCATSDANNPSIEFCAGLPRAHVWQARTRERISLSFPFKINWNGSFLWFERRVVKIGEEHRYCGGRDHKLRPRPLLEQQYMVPVDKE
jgi:hypothetical protein